MGQTIAGETGEGSFGMLQNMTLLIVKGPTLPEINSSPLKIGHPKRTFHLPTVHFQVLC